MPEKQKTFFHFSALHDDFCFLLQTLLRVLPRNVGLPHLADGIGSLGNCSGECLLMSETPGIFLYASHYCFKTFCMNWEIGPIISA